MKEENKYNFKNYLNFNEKSSSELNSLSSQNSSGEAYSFEGYNYPLTPEEVQSLYLSESFSDIVISSIVSDNYGNSSLLISLELYNFISSNFSELLVVDSINLFEINSFNYGIQTLSSRSILNSILNQNDYGNQNLVLTNSLESILSENIYGNNVFYLINYLNGFDNINYYGIQTLSSRSILNSILNQNDYGSLALSFYCVLGDVNSIEFYGFLKLSFVFNLSSISNIFLPGDFFVSNYINQEGISSEESLGGLALYSPWKISIKTSSPAQVYSVSIIGNNPQINIDWGDGRTTDVVTSGTFSNQYSSSGDYFVRISGNFSSDGRILVGSSIIRSIDPAPQFNGLTSFEDSLKNSINLSSVPWSLFYSNKNVTSFKSCFEGCSSLTSIPTNSLGQSLFSNNNLVLSFEKTFKDCALQNIPSSLFESATLATNFESTFRNCNFTSIPSNLFSATSNALNFSFCFFQCSNLASLPPDLFSNNVLATNFTRCFGSTSITEVPSGFFDFNVQATNFESCFRSCFSLVSLPSFLFSENNNVSNFNYCFMNTGLTLLPDDVFELSFNPLSSECTFVGCFWGSNLLEVPQDLFKSFTNASTFDSCFKNTQVTQVGADLFRYNINCRSFVDCFENCTINPNSYGSLLQSLSIYNFNQQPTIFDAGNSKYYPQDSVYKNTLLENNWIIYDGGVIPFEINGISSIASSGSLLVLSDLLLDYIDDSSYGNLILSSEAIISLLNFNQFGIQQFLFSASLSSIYQDSFGLNEVLSSQNLSSIFDDDYGNLILSSEAIISLLNFNQFGIYTFSHRVFLDGFESSSLGNIYIEEILLGIPSFEGYGYHSFLSFNELSSSSFNSIFGENLVYSSLILESFFYNEDSVLLLKNTSVLFGNNNLNEFGNFSLNFKISIFQILSSNLLGNFDLISSLSVGNIDQSNYGNLLNKTVICNQSIDVIELNNQIINQKINIQGLSDFFIGEIRLLQDISLDNLLNNNLFGFNEVLSSQNLPSIFDDDYGNFTLNSKSIISLLNINQFGYQQFLVSPNLSSIYQDGFGFNEVLSSQNLPSIFDDDYGNFTLNSKPIISLLNINQFGYQQFLVSPNLSSIYQDGFGFNEVLSSQNLPSIFDDDYGNFTLNSEILIDSNVSQNHFGFNYINDLITIFSFNDSLVNNLFVNEFLKLGDISSSEDLFNGISRKSFYFEESISWSVNKKISQSLDLSWDIGQGELRWYRVQGCCKFPTSQGSGDGISGNFYPGGCDVSNFESDDDKCVGAAGRQLFVQNVLATSLVDVCEQLKKSNFKWQVCSIKVFSKPASSTSDECNILQEVPFSSYPECIEISLDGDLLVKTKAKVFVYDAVLVKGSGNFSLFSNTNYYTNSNILSIYNYEGSGSFSLSGESLYENSFKYEYVVPISLNFFVLYEEADAFDSLVSSPDDLVGVTSDVRTICGNCSAIPSVLYLYNNLLNSSVFDSFLKSNSVEFPEYFTLHYSSKLRSWNSNYQISGLGDYGEESWNFVFSWFCIDEKAEEPSDPYWKFYGVVNRKIPYFDLDFDSKINIIFPPDQLCSAIDNFFFNFSFDFNVSTGFVRNDFVSVTDYSILVDNIGLFKSSFWEDNPWLNFNITRGLLSSKFYTLDLTPIL